jgi:hypothetical protein
MQIACFRPRYSIFEDEDEDEDDEHNDDDEDEYEKSPIISTKHVQWASW